LKQIASAERNITRSIFLLENNNTDSIRLATSYSIYASLLNQKGFLNSAISYYQKAFELNKAKAYWRQCAKDMLDLGYLYDAGLQNDIKALACYNQGVKMLEKSGDVYQLAGIYINMGVMNWRKKNFRQALQFYQKALNVLPIRFRDTSIKSNPSLNMLKLVANDYYISTLLSNKGEALLDQYRVEKNKELLHAALASFEAADKSVDLMRWKQYGDQSKLFWRGKTKSMYGNAIEVCYLLNDVEKAFYFFEKSRALLLNDKLSELGAKKFLSPSDNIKEQQLRIRISSLNSQLASLKEGDTNYKSARRNLLAAQEEWEKFIRGLEVKYPVYYQYKYENAAYPVRSIKNKLSANNQSLVEFFNSDSVVYVLSISGNKQVLLRVSYPEYGNKARSFITACSRRMMLKQDYSEYKELAYELYEKLLKPLHLPLGRVIISPDDYFIPFEALISDKALSSGFLLRQYAFSYTYSMALLMKKTDHSPANGQSFLGVAPVHYSPALHLEPLMGADRSLQDILPYFKHTSVLTNDQATKHEFLQKWSQYSMVQIYSHADADSTDIEPVLFLRDSAVHINEIQPRGDYQTEMIILSACKTGVGKNAIGEGIFSLARAFMSVGIPSTVTTLWQVDNHATFNLTEAFYKYLSKGLPKDIAMQKAKLELIDNNDDAYRLPYFWAGNILLGKTTSINENEAGKHGLIITSAIYAVLISLFALARINKRNQVKGSRLA
ncbi:MAG TPA: CHAT domain-containing tetratricopeptide repeat protein, partial [Chitinophagaceae bacterium]|nr:CHAT domain-containing tetratricopeptide repeat protein [Chitinophagaceae bacterium]